MSELRHISCVTPVLGWFLQKRGSPSMPDLEVVRCHQVWQPDSLAILQFTRERAEALFHSNLDLKSLRLIESTKWHGHRRVSPSSTVLRIIEVDGKLPVVGHQTTTCGFQLRPIITPEKAGAVTRTSTRLRGAVMQEVLPYNKPSKIALASRPSRAGPGRGISSELRPWPWIYAQIPVRVISPTAARPLAALSA